MTMMTVTVTVTVTDYLYKPGHTEAVSMAFYAFHALWFHFPQSGALAEGTEDVAKINTP
jgi:hypothetical protein